MIEDWKHSAFLGAVRALSGQPPRDLIPRAQPDAIDRGESLDATDLTELLRSASGVDPLVSELGTLVHQWDIAAATEQWTQDTEPSTHARRQLICESLGLNNEGAVELTKRRPIYRLGTTVISGPWERWYTPARAKQRAFYWANYRRYLVDVKRWPEESVTGLDFATTQVVERLANPTQDTVHQAKGLVVGYVQSGKTANFTGVVAKAIDAGYRLVIVMTGTIELLRSQTQRRMDMELVGRRNILGDLTEDEAVAQGVDYLDDPAWQKGLFNNLDGELPIEIQRLTRYGGDYKKQFATLQFERFEREQPMWNEENLFRTKARVAIVKKNAAVLRKLVGDVRANKNRFAEIPVLIIDDESDQASVNTVDPEKVRAAEREGKEIKARRAINEQIAEMLSLMPRAQYVGYTATPFANVFVDPADEQGIFPKDFVIGLPRPAGYMGVEDFHDFVEPGEERPSPSNEHSLVRSLTAAEDDLSAQDRELRDAIDTFVLAGAAKLYRMDLDPSFEFLHHTMLVHQSVRKDEHRELAERIQSIWSNAEYQTASGRRRLQQLYEADLLPVSSDQLEPGVPPLPPFVELAPFVAKALRKITDYDRNPVLVVNSDKDLDQQELDFDRNPTWRILVGGAKLSRGFTVEGLTVTYFRRATNMSDSLTQMGRWFGFRRGYRDLVRLFIAREARFGKKTVDLYKAFEGIALDEQAFRAQLEQYAEWDGDSPAVLPRDIPPLVQQHLPWLRPTARNKMFNAVLVRQPARRFSPGGFPNDLADLRANLDIWRSLIAEATEMTTVPATSPMYAGLVDADSFVNAIRNTTYLEGFREPVVKPTLAYYDELLARGLLDEVLLLVPQPNTGDVVDIDSVGERAVVSRRRRVGRVGKFGELTEPKHRDVAENFVRGKPLDSLAALHGSTVGSALVYLVREPEPDFDVPAGESGGEAGLVVAFDSYVPQRALDEAPKVPTFQVRNAARRGDASVDVED